MISIDVSSFLFFSFTKPKHEVIFYIFLGDFRNDLGAVNSPGGRLPASTNRLLQCFKDWDPVCGSDKQTYPNKCHLECAGKFLFLVREGCCELKTMFCFIK